MLCMVIKLNILATGSKLLTNYPQAPGECSGYLTTISREKSKATRKTKINKRKVKIRPKQNSKHQARAQSLSLKRSKK